MKGLPVLSEQSVNVLKLGKSLETTPSISPFFKGEKPTFSLSPWIKDDKLAFFSVNHSVKSAGVRVPRAGRTGETDIIIAKKTLRLERPNIVRARRKRRIFFMTKLYHEKDW